MAAETGASALNQQWVQRLVYFFIVLLYHLGLIVIFLGGWTTTLNENGKSLFTLLSLQYNFLEEVHQFLLPVRS